MGFKKMQKQIKEEDFLNNARGENTAAKKQKRTKRFLIYFTDDEFQRVQKEAENIGMGINQYVRFMIFNNRN